MCPFLGFSMARTRADDGMGRSLDAVACLTQLVLRRHREPARLRAPRRRHRRRRCRCRLCPERLRCAEE